MTSFEAATDAEAIRRIRQSAADNSPAPQALVSDDNGNYELRPLLGAFCGYMEWERGEDVEVIPVDGDITAALKRFAPISAGERLVRII